MVHEIQKRILSTVDWILYHPIVDNVQVRTQLMTITLMLIIFACLIAGWLELAIIFTFSIAMGR